MNIPLERTVPLIQAKKNIIRALSRLGIQPEISTYGTEYGVSFCNLNGKKNLNYCSGFGKGLDPLAAEVGALFEAYEHFCMVNYQNQSISCELIDSLADQEFFEDIPLSIIRHQKEASLGCLTYTSIKGNKIKLPIALSNPFYLTSYKKHKIYAKDNVDYRFFQKYSSSNGIAAGSSLDETIVHSLTENIERQSLGDFLVTSLGTGKLDNAKLIKISSLPCDLINLIDYIEKLFHGTLELIELYNELNIPVYIAYLNTPDRYARVFGCGCSLNNTLALSRALTEVLQLRARKGENRLLRINSNKKTFKAIESSSINKNFCLLNIGDLLHNGSPERVEFEDNQSISSFTDYKNKLFNKIKQSGCDFYYTLLREDCENSTYCINGLLAPYDSAFLLSKGVDISVSNRQINKLASISLKE